MNVSQYVDMEAERMVITTLGQRPGEWQQVPMFLAADRLLALDLVEVRHGDTGAWEYRLSAAGRRVALYLAPPDDRVFRNHPDSNYNGGPIEGNVLLDSPPWVKAREAQEAGEDIEPGSDDPAFYGQQQEATDVGPDPDEPAAAEQPGPWG